MRSARALALVVVFSRLIVPPPASAQPPPGEGSRAVEVHGQVRQETAYRVDTPGKLTKLKQQVLLTESARLNERLRVKSTQRVYYDAVFALTDHFPASVESDQEAEAELRELYLDYSQGPFDVRVGKQPIVWGEAVGLFFADVVNAKDLRESILPDFDLIRIPQWGLDVEWSHARAHAEFIWLPGLEFNKLGVRGSEFELPVPVPPGTPWVLADPATPPSSVSNSEVGTRLSYLLAGWDVRLFYFYTWDKFPVLFRTIQQGVFHFAPAYRRAHLVGGSWSKEIREVILKGEWVLNPRGHFSTFDRTDSDGVVQRTFVDYLVGLDYTWFGRLQSNIQLMQRIIANHPDLLARDDAVRTHVSVWLKTDFLHGKVEPEFLVIAGLSQQDLLYRPKVTVHLTDSLQWLVGADIFQGEPTGLFGQFDENSRVYTELRFQW